MGSGKMDEVNGNLKELEHSELLAVYKTLDDFVAFLEKSLDDARKEISLNE